MHAPTVGLFIAGAAFWLQSQISDVLLNPISSLRWTITPEETGESLGSALWLFAFLVWMRSVLPVEPRPLQPANGDREIGGDRWRVEAE